MSWFAPRRSPACDLVPFRTLLSGPISGPLFILSHLFWPNYLPKCVCSPCFLCLTDEGTGSNWGQMPAVALAVTPTPCPPVFAHVMPLPVRVLLPKKAGPFLAVCRARALFCQPCPWSWVQLLGLRVLLGTPSSACSVSGAVVSKACPPHGQGRHPPLFPPTVGQTSR